MQSFKRFSIVACVDKKMRIGNKGAIPWHSSEDLKHFKRLTMGSNSQRNAVIMGRKTWDSISTIYKPLTGRNNYVITRDNSTREKLILEGAIPHLTFESAIMSAQISDNIFVVGGAEIYKKAITHPLCDKIYLTRVNYDKELNDRESVYFPVDPENASFHSYEESCLDTDGFARVTNYQREYPESAYLRTMEEILKQPLQQNRTLNPTHNLFARQLRYPLIDALNNDIIPFTTTKKLAWKTCFKELFWFLSGSPNARGIPIWEANTNAQALKKLGLDYPEYTLGPGGYGPTWRHFGGVYDRITNTMSGGIDQLENVIFMLKNDPFSRRHVVSAWDPRQIDKTALPPCHYTFSFAVSEGLDGKLELSCSVKMRSNDMFLGHPFNVASYGLLTHIIAKLCNMRAKELVITSDIAHIYKANVEAAQKQCTIAPYGYPHIKFINGVLYIDGVNINDILISDYYHGAKITSKMIA